MFESSQHAQFPVDSLAGDEVLEDVGHLLQGHPLPVPGVGHGPAHTPTRLVTHGDSNTVTSE